MAKALRGKAFVCPEGNCLLTQKWHGDAGRLSDRDPILFHEELVSIQRGVSPRKWLACFGPADLQARGRALLEELDDEQGYSHCVDRCSRALFAGADLSRAWERLACEPGGGFVCLRAGGDCVAFVESGSDYR